MNRRMLLCIAVAALTCLQAVAAPATVPRLLDPDGEMHGVRFGATEEQVRAVLGPPTGTLQISDSRQAWLYGKSHAFVFRKGRFVELHVTHHLIDWELAEHMEDHPLLNSARWTLKPGIEERMKFGEVARLLNKPSAKPDYHFSYETDKASVELSFSGSFENKGSPDEFSLISVRIRSLVLQW